MKSAIISRVAMFLLLAPAAQAEVAVKWLKSANFHAMHSNSVVDEKIAESEILKRVPASEAREVRLQALPNNRVEVQVLSRIYHRMDRYQAAFDDKGHFASLKPARHLPPAESLRAQCPDLQTQFIAFAPNDDQLEQATTEEVAVAAEKAGLKVVRLLREEATRANYLNYMACPSLKGNFYDGDADPTSIVTVDGLISSEDLAQNLTGAFRYSVTNIWLACQAYNNPMLETMITTTQSQKYAAGKNNLLVGPSDRTGACAMEKALEGQPMTAAFKACYKAYDDKADKWGFGGKGSDQFGD